MSRAELLTGRTKMKRFVDIYLRVPVKAEKRAPGICPEPLTKTTLCDEKNGYCAAAAATVADVLVVLNTNWLATATAGGGGGVTVNTSVP